jgi:hypothetical protein
LDETIYHLFIYCKFAKLLRQVVNFTFNMPPPTNITNIFGNWLNGMANKTKAHIRIDVCALLWAIWNYRNDIIFDRATRVQFLHVINTTTYWINMWSYLFPKDQRVFMDTGCTRQMVFIRAIFSRGGW